MVFKGAERLENRLVLSHETCKIFDANCSIIGI